MMRTWGMAVGAVLLVAGSSTLAADKKKPVDNSKILAEIQKLQADIAALQNKKNSDLQAFTSKIDAEIQKVKAAESKENNVLRKLRSDKQAAIDLINNAWAQARMQFVNKDAQLKQQISQKIQERDNALVGLMGDAFNSVRDQFNVTIAALRAQLTANGTAWQQGHDKRISDVNKINSQFDQKINAEIAKDQKDNSVINKLLAEKQKHLGEIAAKYDKQIAGKNAKIVAEQKKLK